MSKIVTADVTSAMPYSYKAMSALGFSDINSYNYWQVREKARFMSGEYTPINIPGDDPMRFAHQASDGVRIAYTKDEYKGRDDLQTVITLKEYCNRFDLDIPTAPAPSLTDAPSDLDIPTAPAPSLTDAPSDNAIVFAKAQDTKDSELADLTRQHFQLVQLAAEYEAEASKVYDQMQALSSL